MEWLLGAALIASLIALLGVRKMLKNALAANSNLVRIADQARAADNALVVAVLAREVANEMMQRDEEKYKKNFERLHYKWKEIEKRDKKTKQAHAETITAKYVSFLDFDELGTQAHVLYADGFGYKSDDDLWELYESIRLYDALSCELNEEWRMHGASITEKELEHLKEYCRKLGDTKLLAHLYNAREQLHDLMNSNVERERDSDWEYETKDYKFKRIADVAESRWGVYVKSMDRYGMWGVFVDEKVYTSFYAADKDFNEKYIDNLYIRLCLNARDYSRTERMEY
jgi:hypothetical protein